MLFRYVRKKNTESGEFCNTIVHQLSRNDDDDDY